MGSLNGTLVNSRPASVSHKANSIVRQRGRPTPLSNGDTITLGSSSNVLVSILEKFGWETILSIFCLFSIKNKLA